MNILKQLFGGSPSCFFCKGTGSDLKSYVHGIYGGTCIHYFHEACMKKVLEEGPEQHGDKNVDIAIEMADDVVNEEEARKRKQLRTKTLLTELDSIK